MTLTVLLTGAAGFIGSHAAVALAARGDRVIGLDNFNSYYDPRRKRANVAEIAAQAPAADFRLIEGDLRDKPLIERLFAEHRFDVVVHLAAMAGVRPSIERPAYYARVNIEGTANLLQAAVDHGVKKFLFASSS
ncbi:MAG TPA: NAD-dependent epimerase/dehydratase family protein, partial [Polyangiaceae bacterium]|nr:NAD-dependent epimerase/dehydratase family protein [Polyangiaceae bacterium]